MTDLRKIPKFNRYDIEKMLSDADTLPNFWVTLCETGFVSISRKYVISVLNLGINDNEYVKFLKKLKNIDKSAIKSYLPKYIVVQPIRMNNKDKPESDGQKLLKVLDETLGNQVVKIVPVRPGFAQIEIWLKDDAELATLEFYQISNPELFYY